MSEGGNSLVLVPSVRRDILALFFFLFRCPRRQLRPVGACNSAQLHLPPSAAFSSIFGASSFSFLAYSFNFFRSHAELLFSRFLLPSLRSFLLAGLLSFSFRSLFFFLFLSFLVPSLSVSECTVSRCLSAEVLFYFPSVFPLGLSCPFPAPPRPSARAFSPLFHLGDP